MLVTFIDSSFQMSCILDDIFAILSHPCTSAEFSRTEVSPALGKAADSFIILHKMQRSLALGTSPSQAVPGLSSQAQSTSIKWEEKMVAKQDNG